MSRTRPRSRSGRPAPAHPRTRGAVLVGQRSRPRPSSLHSVAPPALALLVSSPAIVAALNGSTDPIHALTIVAVSLVAAWVLSAVGVKVADAVPARVTQHPAPPVDGGSDHGAAAVALGRIEPIQVPAADAIPGTPPPPSDVEGQLP